MQQPGHREWTGELRSEHDIVVVGSGAIGLTAALAASRAGADVAVLEKGPCLGGTAALSGGMVWIALNHQMREMGIADDREDALRYLRAVCEERTPEPVLAAVVDRGDELLGFLEAEADLRFEPLENFPDYHPEWDGAHAGGRSLEPVLYDGSRLGELVDALRPDARPPFTMREYEEWGTFTRFPWSQLDQRARDGMVARGRAFVAPLVRACADAGVTLVTGLGARRLTTDGGAVDGVVTTDGRTIGAARGVILTCGGFEWAPEMTRSFLSGPVQGACSPPHNTGDGIRMASKVGAKLGSMREAWWGPMVQVPGEETDGEVRSTLLRFERTGPGTVIVNRAGRCFVNEAHNYNDMTKAFHLFDPRAYRYANLPAWLIFDQRHLETYGFLSHRSDQPTPEWLHRAPTLEALAALIDVDAGGLLESLERFNANARAGEDPDFHRGESAYDRYWGDQSAPYPALGPVDAAPFYAIEVISGVLGTKGGVVTTADGQAVDAFDEPIAGLYAAGNTSAHPMGPGYCGAGATLGPGATMAYLAALHCVRAGTRDPGAAGT